MADQDSGTNDERLAASPSTRSIAQQVTYWLILLSLLVAVGVMGAWWMAAAIPVTRSTTFIFMFATVGLWTMVHHLLILAIKRWVGRRIARREAGRA